jgi:hypothetical protein
MSSAFRVWNDARGYEEEDAVELVAFDAAAAAAEVTDQRFSDWSYPTWMELHVRNVETQEIGVYEVTVEMVPSFHATKKRSAP